MSGRPPRNHIPVEPRGDRDAGRKSPRASSEPFTLRTATHSSHVETRRHLNWSLLLLTSVAVSSVTALGMWSWRRQSSRQGESLLETARRAEQTGDDSTAAAALARYLENRPADVDALVRLGEVRLRTARSEKDYADALSAYTGAASASDDPNVAARAAELLLLSKPASAIERTEKILAEHRAHPPSLRVRALGMDAQWSQRRDDKITVIKVIEGLERGVEADPGNGVLALRLASLLRLNANTVAVDRGLTAAEVERLADQFMDQLVVHSRTASDRLARFAYRRRFRLVGPTEKDLDLDVAAALASDPTGFESNLAAAENLARSWLYQSAQRTDDAEPKMTPLERRRIAEYAGQARKARPSDPRSYVVLSQVARVEGDYLRASEELQAGLRACEPPQPGLESRMAELLIDRGDWAAARRMLETAISSGESGRRRDKSISHRRELECSIQLMWHRWYREELNPQRNPVAAIKALRSAIGACDEPNRRAALRVELARDLENLEAVDLAIDEYERAKQDDPSFIVARQRLAHALFVAGRFPVAAGEFDDLLSRAQDDRSLDPASLAGGAALARLGRELARPEPRRVWSDLDAAVAELQRRDPNSPLPGFIRLAKEYARNGPLAASRLTSELEQLAEKSSNNPLSSALAAQWRLTLDAPQEALPSIEKLSRSDSASAAWIRARQAREASSRHAKGLVLEPKPTWLPASLTDLLASPLNLTKPGGVELINAKELENHLLQFPDDADSIARLALLEVSSGNLRRAAELERSLATKEGPDGWLAPSVRIARTLRAARDGDVAEIPLALTASRELLTKRPQWRWSLRAAAVAADLAGEPDRARQLYHQAAMAGDLDPMLVSRALVFDDRLASISARDLLASLPEELRYGPAVLPIAVRIHLRNGDVDEATALVDGAIARRPDDVEAMIQRLVIKRANATLAADGGYVLEQVAHRAGADILAQMALVDFSTDPSAPASSWLAQSLAALRLLIEARPEWTSVAAESLMFARIAELSGDFEKAERFYRRAGWKGVAPSDAPIGVAPSRVRALLGLLRSTTRTAERNAATGEGITPALRAATLTQRGLPSDFDLARNLLMGSGETLPVADERLLARLDLLEGRLQPAIERFLAIPTAQRTRDDWRSLSVLARQTQSPRALEEIRIPTNVERLPIDERRAQRASAFIASRNHVALVALAREHLEDDAASTRQWPARLEEAVDWLAAFPSSRELPMELDHVRSPRAPWLRIGFDARSKDSAAGAVQRALDRVESSNDTLEGVALVDVLDRAAPSEREFERSSAALGALLQKSDSKAPVLIERLSYYLADHGDNVGAARLLEQGIAQFPQQGRLIARLAELCLGDPNEASRGWDLALRGVREHEPTELTISVFARYLIQKKQPAIALAVLTNTMGEASASIESRLTWIEAARAGGQLGAADAAWKRLSQSDRRFQSAHEQRLLAQASAAWSRRR